MQLLISRAMITYVAYWYNSNKNAHLHYDFSFTYFVKIYSLYSSLERHYLPSPLPSITVFRYSFSASLYYYNYAYKCSEESV